MHLTVRRTWLMNTAHLPDSFKPRKGKTLVVHVETPTWSNPPSHPDYTEMQCTGLGRRWSVRVQYTTAPTEGSRVAANDEEWNFIVEARNLMITHSIDLIEFHARYPLLF